MDSGRERYLQAEAVETSAPADSLCQIFQSEGNAGPQLGRLFTRKANTWILVSVWHAMYDHSIHHFLLYH